MTHAPPNPVGHPDSLVPFENGNKAAEKHGLYSRQRLPLSLEEEEELALLLALPHVVSPDAAAAEEIVRMRSLIARVDTALSDGVVERRGRARELVDLRRRLSSQLLNLLESFGLTPKSRSSSWARSRELSASQKAQLRALGVRVDE